MATSSANCWVSTAERDKDARQNPFPSKRASHGCESKSHGCEVLRMKVLLDAHPDWREARHDDHGRRLPSGEASPGDSENGHHAGEQEDPSQIGDTERRDNCVALQRPASHGGEPLVATVAQSGTRRKSRSVPDTGDGFDPPGQKWVHGCAIVEVDVTQRRVHAHELSMGDRPTREINLESVTPGRPTCLLYPGDEYRCRDEPTEGAPPPREWSLKPRLARLVVDVRGWEGIRHVHETG